MADIVRAGNDPDGTLDSFLSRAGIDPRHFEGLPRETKLRIMQELLTRRAEQEAAIARGEAAGAERDAAWQRATTSLAERDAAQAAMRASESSMELDRERLRREFGLSDGSVAALQAHVEAQRAAAGAQLDAERAREEAARQALVADRAKEDYYRSGGEREEAARPAAREEPAQAPPAQEREREGAPEAPGGRAEEGAGERSEGKGPGIVAAAATAAATEDPLPLIASLVASLNSRGREQTGAPQDPVSYDAANDNGDFAKAVAFAACIVFVFLTWVQVLRGLG